MEPEPQQNMKPELPSDKSHLLVEAVDGEALNRVHAYLDTQGIRFEQNRAFRDDEGRLWMVLSLPLPDVGRIVLDLLEKGFGSKIQGINAAKSILRGEEWCDSQKNQ
jgi:hypothetical protein